MEQSVSVKYDDFTFIFNLTRRLDRFDVHDCKHNLSRNLHSWILLLIPRPAHGHDDYDDDDDDDDGDDDDDDDLYIMGAVCLCVCYVFSYFNYFGR